MLNTTPETKCLSAEEFLRWLDEDTWAEWKKGEVIRLSPASRTHQRLVHFIADLIGYWAEQQEAGTVLFAPFPLKLRLPDGEISVREPDIVFIGKRNADRFHETFAESPVDLVVEIMSPESRARDRGEKFCEYEAAGIAEYWLIDPDRQRAEFYQLQANGAYEAAAPSPDGVYESKALHGFWIRIEWLWQSPLPRLSDIIALYGQE